MEFDKSKVYTVLNANKVKIGSRGYFAENLKSLRDAVEENIQYGEISEIKDESFAGRFRTKGDGCCYSLFYLMEEPKKKVEFRAYNDMNEMIEDFKKRFYLVPQVLRLPQIWVNGKPESNCKDEIVQITGFYKDFVTIGRAYGVNEFTLYELFDHFTYLDGSPCGIKED